MSIFLPSYVSPLGAAAPSAGTAVMAQGAMPFKNGVPGGVFGIDAEREGLPGPAGAIGEGGGVFSRLLDDARERDVRAQQAIESFARTDDPGRIHETMVAVSKAEIALRTVAAVRNKLLDAYRDLQHVTS